MAIKAIYQNGVFKPLGTVGLTEGEWVELEIVPTSPPRSKKIVSLRGIWKDHVRSQDKGDWIAETIAEVRRESDEKLERLALELSDDGPCG